MIRKSALASSRLPLSLAALGLAALGCVFPASAARALEEGAGEAKAIDACDKRLCTILQQKNPSGEDLKCLLTKTWAKSSLKGDRSVGWGFGDARCTVQIDISRARIVATVIDKDTKFAVPAHTAHCIVEQDGELKTVKATLAPKIVFKGGKAENIWINLLHVEGPAAIKATMTTAAQPQRHHRPLPPQHAESGQRVHLQALPEGVSADPVRHGDPYEAGTGQAGKSRPAGCTQEPEGG